MRALAILIVLGLLSCLNGCNKVNTAENKQPEEISTEIENQVPGMEMNDTMETGSDDMINEEADMEKHNRTLIANALGVEENARNIRFIMGSLDALDAGYLQSASLDDNEAESVMDVVSEDGTNYRVFLTSSGKVDAIQDKDTGEWKITSER